jgi:predicted transcriptional regulator YheO
MQRSRKKNACQRNVNMLTCINMDVSTSFISICMLAAMHRVNMYEMFMHKMPGSQRHVREIEC